MTTDSLVRTYLRLVAGIFLIACLNSCKHDDDAENPWQVAVLWPEGSRPVPSVAQGDVLFLKEQPPAGFYLLRSGTAMPLNPTGPDVRADYAWSPDGSRFCFSSPGEPGSATAGIYIATRDNPTTFTRLWDRGEHPRFIPGNEFLLCAGAQGGPDAGIWQIPLAGGAPALVIPTAFAPEVSPNGLKIAYLLPIATLNSQLVVLNRETGARDTLTNNVLNFSWLGDSETLVFECSADGQSVRYIRLELGAMPVVVGPGTHPAGFPSGTEFVYTGLESDHLAGLRLAAPGTPSIQITPGGTWAMPVNSNRIVAQDGTALVEVTR